MRVVTVAEQALLAQRGHLFLWVPVAFGTGIGLYFGLPAEPGPAVLAALGGLAMLAMILSRPAGDAWGPLLLGLGIVGAGLLTAALRAKAVAAPVLDFRYFGPVEGRIVDIDRAASDVPRLTLDRVVLADVPPGRTPARVRVSVHGDQPDLPTVPGTVVILTAHLSPPAGPTEPGDFDFRRVAWFEGLGAVGYTRTPVLTLAPAEPGPGLWLNRLRLGLSAAVRDLIPGDAGGLAAAVMTGDRSGLSVGASNAMRDSNLYHIVSISGMHMAMLTAFVFALIRGGVALVPPLALRVSSKKVAAAVALPVAAFYLALAGRDVATERAFVMVAVMLVAILLDRQALSLRGVAIAALIVLALRPETLTNPGFQMSFAAVIALIVSFRAIGAPQAGARGAARLVWPVLLLLFSSLVAGLATAPFAAAHFNRMAHYGLLANLLAVPVMGFLVMPGAVILAILGPIGLGQPAVWMIDYGCRWVIAVAEVIAAQEGAVSAVVTPPPAVLPMMAGGMLLVLLWQGRARWLGLALPAWALALWTGAKRPHLLIAESGGLAGVMTEGGRVLTKPAGDGFAAANWLENDGDTASQAEAAQRGRIEGRGGVTRMEVGGHVVLHVAGRRALAGLDGCGGADILVSSVEVERALPCLVFDPVRLRRTGAVALTSGPEGLRLVTAGEAAGLRPWTRPAADRAAADRPAAPPIPANLLLAAVDQ